MFETVYVVFWLFVMPRFRHLNEYFICVRVYPIACKNFIMFSSAHKLKSQTIRLFPFILKSIRYFDALRFHSFEKDKVERHANQFWVAPSWNGNWKNNSHEIHISYFDSKSGRGVCVCVSKCSNVCEARILLHNQFGSIDIKGIRKMFSIQC